MEKTYVQAVRLNKLHSELLAAGITPSLVQGTSEPGPVYASAHIVAPQTTDVVDAVLAAHDPTTPSVAEQQTTGDQADIDAFPTRAQVQAALAAITTDLQTLSGAITLAQAGPILRRTVTNQQAIIRALAVIVRRAGN